MKMDKTENTEMIQSESILFDETELNKQIGEFLKQNPGYKVYGKSPSQSVKESHFPVNTQVMYKGQKAQIIQLKEPPSIRVIYLNAQFF